MLAERLKLLRENKGFTQKQLAKIINTSSSSIAMWETNKREPDMKMIRKFAEFFGVSTDYLLGITDVPYSPNQEQSTPNNFINLNELSEESKQDLLKQLDMLKMRDNLKKYNKDGSSELQSELD